MQVLRTLLVALLALVSVTGDDEFEFWDACAAGDLDVVKSLVDSGAVDLEYPSDDGRTPLLIAVTEGHAAVATVLVEAGATIETPGSFPFAENTPLGAAAANGDIAMMAALLAAGAQINGPSLDGRTPLMCAVVAEKLDAAKWLVDAGADVLSTKIDGTSALFWAAKAGDAGLVNSLIGSGSNVSAVDLVDGSQPLHYAGQAISPEAGDVVRALIAAGADPAARSLVLVPKADASNPDADPNAEPKREDLRGGLTPLMTAAGAGAIGAMEALLDALPDDAARLYDVAGMTSVSYAAQAGQAAAVRILLARGGSAGGYTVEGRAPLHLAAYGGLHQCAAVLVKDGNAPVDMRSKEGHTALIIASFQGHDRMVKKLLKLGADIDARSGDGATPLIAASSGGHYKIAKRLLRSGAEAIAQLQSGETAAMVTKNKPLARMLYKAEARALERMHQDLEARKKLAAAEDVDTADDMYDDTNADGSADDAFSQMLDDVDEEGEGDDEDEVDLDADDPTPNHVEL